MNPEVTLPALGYHVNDNAIHSIDTQDLTSSVDHY